MTVRAFRETPGLRRAFRFWALPASRTSCASFASCAPCA